MEDERGRQTGSEAERETGQGGCSNINKDAAQLGWIS